MSSTYIVIGAPGVGKTPYIRSFINNRRCLIFDIQNEYGKEKAKYEGQSPYGLPDNTLLDRSRYKGNDVDEFIRIASAKRKTVIVFEEATAFFEGKTGKKLRRYLIDRFHTGNVSLFIFHSIAQVPPGIMSLANFVVLFKTLDEPRIIKNRFFRIEGAFEKVSMMPDGSKIIIKLI